MAEHRNIFLVGPMGAGKSTIGRHIAQKLRMDFYDSDQEIERRAGVDISWIFDVEGETKFRYREEKILEDLTNKQGIVLATGGGSILSEINRNKLSSRGIVVYLQTTVEKQLMRTKKDKTRPLLQENISNKIFLESLALKRNPLYKKIADFIVQTDTKSPKIVAQYIINILEKY
ncbi:shikimate kinase I [Buchnera aphidicola (Nipponaphis monzeni)]|uniref:Shikimate kinase 1 n=1 Tax=Buchnera aphidicola (Nipponaphis monzeni) TaxID=2495405 RepID=A0A455TAS3_9GAMM|nr:shikimate kinase AroK [Buchnera aphidicola]BBI01414.1 shikimate kinase I [Buchnera aphidicola (Nipponaphis monzeni)]